MNIVRDKQYGGAIKMQKNNWRNVPQVNEQLSPNLT